MRPKTKKMMGYPKRKSIQGYIEEAETYTKNKFRDISKDGRINGQFKMVFEIDDSKEIILAKSGKAIGNRSPIYLWGYPNKHSNVDGFSEEDKKELQIQLVNTKRDLTKVCISMPSGSIFPDWVMNSNWKTCEVSVRLNKEKTSLKVINIKRLSLKDSDDEFDEDLTFKNALLEKEKMDLENEKTKLKKEKEDLIAALNETKNKFLAERNQLLAENNEILKKTVKIQEENTRLHRENTSLVVALGDSEKNCKKKNRLQQKLKHLFCF